MFPSSASAVIASTTLIATLLLLCACAVCADNVFNPTRIPYNSLFNGNVDASFFEALQEHGIVSITGVPDWDAPKALSHLIDCTQHDGESFKKYTFPDGTRRHTVATQATGLTLIQAASELSHQSCQALETDSRHAREMVLTILQAFVNLISRFYKIEDLALLKGEDGHRITLPEIVSQGQHLEHFHVYHYPESLSSEKTIDWHIDQGLMLAIMPGMVDGDATEGFYIQLPDGSSPMVNFDIEKDNVIIIMGDGVHQYVNPHLPVGMVPFRSLPHALHLEGSSNSKPRLWYGRMVLPPPQAIHPLYDTEEVTFADVRQMLIKTGDGIGCSSYGSGTQRVLQEEICDEESSSYCWHRCMNFTDYNVSPDICNGRQLSLACVNDEGLLWPETHDPAFYLDCVDLELAVKAPLDGISPVGEGHTNSTEEEDTDHSGHNNHDHSGHDHGSDGHHGGECDEEDETEISYKTRSRTCKWLRKKTTSTTVDICEASQDINDACCTTCKTANISTIDCEAENVEAEFLYKKDKTKTCGWLSLKKASKIRKICRKSEIISGLCCESCGSV